jgi:threonine dehydrogenase-like Zn-dependent dehydrogenase
MSLLEAVCEGPRRLAFRPYEEKPLAATEVRVRATHAAFKHGTELALYTGYAAERGRFDSSFKVFRPENVSAPYPFGVGNMVVGNVTEVSPDVQRLKVGDRVLGYGSLKPTHTLREKDCWILPAATPWQSAVCLDPADFAFAALRDGNVRIGDGVAVSGMGAIALIVVQMARLAGAHPIIAIDPFGMRRDAARKLGATHVINPREEDAGLRLKEITGGRGVDVAIEYSGSPQALQGALRGVAYGGTVVCGAFPPPYGAGLDLGAEAHVNVPNIVFSRACSEPNRDHPRWNNQRIYESCFSMITSGAITGVGIVSDPVPFESSLDAFAGMANDASKTIKIGVSF